MEHVGELMSGWLLAIGPTASVGEASAILTRERVSHLLVTEGGELRGVLCSCDVERAAQSDSVAQAMSGGVVTIDAEASPAEAWKVMKTSGVSCLPVVADGTLRGVVTLHDLVRLGVADGAERCSACGSSEHVRCAQHGARVGLCLECTRRSEPPAWDEEEELGEGD